MIVRAGLLDIRVTTAISITWLSRSLAITTISSIPITTISKRETLWRSVGVAGSITISWLSIGISLAIVTISSVSSVTVTSISRETLWRSVGVAGSITTISWLSLSISLAITIGNVITVAVGSWISISIIRLGNTDGGRSITSIALASLWASVIITTASISMVGNTTITISRL